MKARNREINIFSLSLMDVISGAMGAFLIIMIILARYYVFDPDTTQNADELRLKLDAAVAGLNRIRGGTEGIITELIDEAESTTRGVGGGDTIEQLEALTRGIREDIDLVRNQLGAVQAEANQLERDLQEKNAQLTRAEELISDLEIRNPFVVSASWECPENVDLFVESSRVFESSGEAGRLFDPRIQGAQGFKGDASSDSSVGPTSEVSMIAQTPKNTTYKVFVSLRAPAAPDAVCGIAAHAVGNDGFFSLLPVAVLTPEEQFDYLGVFAVDEDYKITFAAPTDAAREAEREAVRERLRRSPASTN